MTHWRPGGAALDGLRQMSHRDLKGHSLPRFTRRTLLRTAALGTAAWGLDASASAKLIDRAAATHCSSRASLADIEHVVILIQENRSFDHYFGTYRGVDGFATRGRHGSLGAFAQPYPQNRSRAPVGRLLPFRFDTQRADGACTNDITHDWGPQHVAYNGGRGNEFVPVHVKEDGADYGTATMGYYTRADLPWHYALADAFTICDAYHASVLGPTYPNRLYSMSATIDPDGRHGGPVVVNPTNPFTYTWETMPERLQAAGITWKVYSQADSNNNVLPFFKQYQDPANAIGQRGLTPTWPANFEADLAAGQLPQVSWVLAPMDLDEHPPSAPAWGAWVQSRVLSALVAQPQIWERTALFIAYDENGGFFDHVTPPAAPPDTPGEWLTASPLPSAASGIAGPIGLGFRVPALVVSPFSRGGLVCSDRFDHTSLLRFLETRFKVEVPNLSAWRRQAVGDLTSAFGFAARPDGAVPALPATSLAGQQTLSECGPSLAQATANGTVGAGNVPAYPLPATQAMPAQEPGRPRRPHAAVCHAPHHRPHRTHKHR